MAQLDSAVAFSYELVLPDKDAGDAVQYTYAWPVIVMTADQPSGDAAHYNYTWPRLILDATESNGDAAHYNYAWPHYTFEYGETGDAVHCTYAYPSEIVSGTLKYWDETAGVWKAATLKRRINGQWIDMN